MSIPTHLAEFLDSRPSIKAIHRSHPDFSSTKEIFIDTDDVPLLIARPQSETDIAALVKHLADHDIPLIVRAGGHDMSARSVAQDAVQIDMRDVAHVRVAADKTTAYVGGGILTQGLLDGLATEGLMTAVGNAGTVGWCSWAMNGGYGMMSGKYGLGCDQIVGARVVLADGRVVQADERLLKALRGCGPAFGVVAELQIKVYPLTEITAGIIACDNISLLATYFSSLRVLIESTKEVPRELYFQPLVLAIPGQGPSFVVHYVWAGPPSEEQSKWLRAIAGLVEGGKPQVGSVTPRDYARQLTKMVDSHIRGGESRTISIRGLVPSAEAAAAMVKYAERVTPEYGAVMIHELHGLSVEPGRDHPASVFASREIHLMVEIFGLAYQDEKSRESAITWGRALYGELSVAEGVMDKEYFPLTQSSALKLETTYKEEDLGFLRELKKELDPSNVFYNGMPLAA